ncbi:FMN-linked oxidoreductase [Linderina pennispora]|uniref:Dihydroorotate dehydrogenase (quinone), mitochondrial n=1 Tax=Linderina pennispora TaxID=61395 RepID=A0A1Y1WFG4_9FUNG|nr:FMN-linked oxidoreductase [Linderina pennispora]ORX72290.1 FMN-linked oxidoreductase [Linderina pennispora]
MFRIGARVAGNRALLSRTFVTKAQAPSKLRNIAWATTGVVLGGLGYLYATDASAGLHKYVSTPLLRLMDAEQSHNLTIWALKNGLSPVDRKADDAALEVELWGKKLSNPVGLAAGFDKNAEAIDTLFGLGFGVVEVGSITPLAQEGNPGTRLFRIEGSRAVVNRMGLNNDGVEVCGERIRSRFWRLLASQSKKQGETVATVTAAVNKSARADRLLGVNLGKNKASAGDSFDDYVYGVQKLGPYADYVVINVSCPNVKNIDASKNVQVLESTIKGVMEARNQMPDYHPPVVIKIGPDNDIDQLRLIAQLALDYKVDGVITTNTTRTRPANMKDADNVGKEVGGLSATTRDMYRLTGGRVPIIGCGGISTAEDALAFGKAGATAVQLLTSMTFEGPGKVREIKDGLIDLLQGRKWADIVGEDA